MNLAEVWDVMMLTGMMGLLLICIFLLPAAGHPPAPTKKVNWLEQVCDDVSHDNQ